MEARLRVSLVGRSLRAGFGAQASTFYLCYVLLRMCNSLVYAIPDVKCRFDAYEGGSMESKG